MAYVKRHPIKVGLKNSIKYIMNENKTDSSILISSNSCAINENLAYEMMSNTKEEFKKTDKILGHHFIQSFKEGEVDEQIAHEIGKKWANKFLHKYEYLLSTHNDKNHIHNHIIINSVSYKDGNKYISDIKELETIRNLSDEVCKEYGLSIIQPKEENRTKTYKEWKDNKRHTSWKDKVKIDINESIKDSRSYNEFLKIMESKEYTLKTGLKYNTFEHIDMGRPVRGYTLGDLYTEENIKKRISELNKDKVVYLDKYKELNNLSFNEKRFLDESLSKRQIVKNDIDAVIKISSNYQEFKEKMSKYRGYVLNDDDKKHITFSHSGMSRGIRGKTIGEGYTRESIQKRIQKNLELKKSIKSEDISNIFTIREKYFRRRSPNSKHKYIKSDRLLNIDSNNIPKDKNQADKLVLTSLKDKKEHYKELYKSDAVTEEFINKEEFLDTIKELNSDIDYLQARNYDKEINNRKESTEQKSEQKGRISIKALFNKFSSNNNNANNNLKALEEKKTKYIKLYTDYKEGKTNKIEGFNSIEDFHKEVIKLKEEIKKYENHINKDSLEDR